MLKRVTGGRAGRSAIKKRLKRSKMENQKMILAASKSGRLTDFDVFKLQCFLSEVEAKKKPSLDSLEPSVRQFLEELNELEAMRTAEEAVVVAAQVEADRVFLEEATAADKILMEGAAAPDRNSIDWMRPRRLTADEKEEYLRSLLGGKTDVEEEMKMDVEAEREEMVVGEERGREREMGMEMPDVGRLALGSEENML